MRFEDLNWMDVEAYLKKDKRLMLILGSCEQHGYLSLTTDVRVPLALTDAASQQTGVLTAPPLNFGVSPEFGAYPGTISLRLQTFLLVLEDMVRWLYRQGFRRLLIINGHGGNTPGQTLLYELANELEDLHIAWYSWWRSPGVVATAEKHGLHPHHASWMEAFPFTRVAPLPEGQKSPVAAERIVDAKQARRLYGDGSFGGPYQADPEVLDEIFNIAVKEIVTELKRLSY